MILEEIKNIKESKKDLKKFGLTLGIAFIVISGILIVTKKNAGIYFGAFGIIITMLGLIAPMKLKLLNKLWMSLSVILGWFMTRVILIILFYIALVPISLLTKLSRKNFLDLKIEKDKLSYWQKREREKSNTVDFERQF